jgi:hypothetical protein
MSEAVVYTGKTNKALGLYPNMRWTTSDAIPDHIKVLIADSPAFASQFVNHSEFTKALPPGASPLSLRGRPKTQPARRSGPPIKRRL